MESGFVSGTATDVQRLFNAKQWRSQHSLFAKKDRLDAAVSSRPAVGREDQLSRLVDLLGDAETGYLPALIQVHGPPGTGKTLVVTQVVTAAMARFPGLHALVVNLKECRTPFAAANQILFQLTGTNEHQNAGVDGVFAKLWDSAREYKFLILVLDEIDAIFDNKRYSASDFLYGLLRRRETGEPPLVCIVTITNMLMGFDSLLDGRVRSRMGAESIDFPPYTEAEIRAIIRDRLDAFRPDALDSRVLEACTRHAAADHGDARRALDLLRTAGELADAEGATRVEPYHVNRAVAALEGERIGRVIASLPVQETLVLYAVSEMSCEPEPPSGFGDQHPLGELMYAAIGPPVHPPTLHPEAVYRRYALLAPPFRLAVKSYRRFLQLLEDLEKRGLVGTAMQSDGRHGRRKSVWVREDPHTMQRGAKESLFRRCRPDLVPRSAELTDEPWRPGSPPEDSA